MNRAFLGQPGPGSRTWQRGRGRTRLVVSRASSCDGHVRLKAITCVSLATMFLSFCPFTQQYGERPVKLRTGSKP